MVPEQTTRWPSAARPGFGADAHGRAGTAGRGTAFVAGSVLVHGLLTILLPRWSSAAHAPFEPPALVEFTFHAEPEPEPPQLPEPEVAVEPPPVAASPAPKPRTRRPRPAPSVRRTTVSRAKTPPAPAAPPPEQTAVAAAPEGTVPVAHAAVSPVASPTLVTTTRVLERPVPAPAAPSPRPDLGPLTRSYLKDLARTLHRKRNYPKRALQQRMEGTVLVSIVIDASGRVERVELKRSSGHALLDRSALAAVRSAPRLPVPPSELRWRTRAVTLPIAYVIR